MRDTDRMATIGTGAEAVDLEDAERIVREAEQAFLNRDVERILDGFTADVRIRFADFPEIKGREEAERFLRARFARQRNYVLRKTLRGAFGNVIVSSWTGTWDDAATGRCMQGRGMELCAIQKGKIADWDAVFNVWEADGGPETPVT